MNRILPAVIAIIAVLVAGLAPAAEPAPATGPSPAAATIDRSAGPAVITSPAAAPATPAPVTAAPAADPATPVAAAPAARPGRAATPAAPGSRPATATGRAQDRLDLEATQITGNRELPRVMYVVPWKRSDVGAGPGRPANSLLDEVLAPVDRDVFLRQGRYYEALRPDAPAAP